MKQFTSVKLLLLFAIIIFFSCQQNKEAAILAKASRYDKNGWIYVHLEGTPSEIGYQHGYLLANDIDTTIQTVEYTLEHQAHHPWSFYRTCASNFLIGKLDEE